MNLYRRTNRDGTERSPFWWMDVSVGGKRYRQSTEREKKAEARLVMEAFIKAKRDQEQLGYAEEVTIEAAMLRYLRSIRNKPDFANALSRARKLIGLDLKVVEGQIQSVGTLTGFWYIPPRTMLHDLTTRTVARLKEERAAEGLGEATVNHEVKQLQRLYNLAPDWGYRRAPEVTFKKYRYRPKLRYATEAEEARVIAHLEDLRDDAENSKMSREARQQFRDQLDLTIFLLDTGARIGEACSLTWASVDTGGWRTINIYRSKVGNEGTLALTERLRSVLRARYAKTGSTYIFPGYDRNTRRETPHRHRDPTSTGGIQKAIDAAGLNAPALVETKGRFTPHSFRDTFATRLVQNGVSLQKVSKLLGHASIVMTMKYAQVEGRATADEAAQVLDAIQARRNLSGTNPAPEASFDTAGSAQDA